MNIDKTSLEWYLTLCLRAKLHAVTDKGHFHNHIPEQTVQLKRCCSCRLQLGLSTWAMQEPTAPHLLFATAS